VKYLLDTCFCSELIKSNRNLGVLEWLEKQVEDDLYISVLTLGELRKGVAKLVDGRRKQRLLRWVEKEIMERFETRILDFNQGTALLWGRLSGELEQQGRPQPPLDGLIAATAVYHELVIVTRNEKDFAAFPVRIENPWIS
jgi:predicted nucleic acid-binding protein